MQAREDDGPEIRGVRQLPDQLHEIARNPARDLHEEDLMVE
jgi:hypothetical protein